MTVEKMIAWDPVGADHICARRQVLSVRRRNHRHEGEQQRYGVGTVEADRHGTMRQSVRTSCSTMLATGSEFQNFVGANFPRTFRCRSIVSPMNRAVNKRFGGAIRWRVQPPPRPDSRGLCVCPGDPSRQQHLRAARRRRRSARARSTRPEIDAGLPDNADAASASASR